MSWGYEKTGTPAAVIKDVNDSFERMAASYKDMPEGADILACRDRIVALVNGMDLTSDGYTNPNAVLVKAGGSHSTTGKGLANASFSVQVQRVSLALDA